MRLSPSQVRCFTQARQICTDQLPKLAWLEQVAQVAPQYAAEVQELRDMLDHLAALCEGCMAAGTPVGQ